MRVESLIVRRATVICTICLAILGGLITAAIGVRLSGVILGLVTVGMAIAFKRQRRLMAACLFLMVIGIWRGQAYSDAQLPLRNLIGESVTIRGEVIDDPALSAKGYLEFRVGKLRTQTGTLPGFISVRTFAINLHRGYSVQVAGTLKDGFGPVPAELFYPQLTVTSTNQTWLERVRQGFFVGVKTALPEPGASFMLGLLVGVRGLVPKDLQAQLNLVGLSHLVAVSGYNLTIMVAAAHRVFQRFGRGTALVASLWLIGGFLLVTGASASIVRASVVAVLALLAAFYGRRFSPMVIILLAATGTALVTPSYLTDLGWMLSFMGFFAVMVVAPAVSARLGSPSWLAAQIFIETLTAHVLTIPIILYYFSQLSIAAPLSNVLVLPLVPLGMLSGFIAGVGGMVMPAWCGWVAWPAFWIVTFMLEVVHWLAAQPWAALNFRMDFVGLVVSYAVLAIGIISIKYANHRAARREHAPDVLDPAGAGVARG